MADRMKKNLSGKTANHNRLFQVWTPASFPLIRYGLTRT